MKEHDIVTLKREINDYPIGTVGVIVHDYGNKLFEVELPRGVVILPKFFLSPENKCPSQ
jgi:hypothetical protein